MGCVTEEEADIKAMANWRELNTALWPHDEMTVQELCALLNRQVHEVLEAEDYHQVEELADIISICTRAIELRGYSIDRAMTYRLLSRHLTYPPSIRSRNGEKP